MWLSALQANVKWVYDGRISVGINVSRWIADMWANGVWKKLVDHVDLDGESISLLLCMENVWIFLITLITYFLDFY